MVLHQLIGLLVLVGAVYLAGRLHQWYQLEADCAEAFDESGRAAHDALFAVAARAAALNSATGHSNFEIASRNP